MQGANPSALMTSQISWLPPIISSGQKSDQRSAAITFDQVSFAECNGDGMALVCWDCTDCDITKKNHTMASANKERDG